MAKLWTFIFIVVSTVALAQTPLEQQLLKQALEDNPNLTPSTKIAPSQPQAPQVKAPQGSYTPKKSLLRFEAIIYFSTNEFFKGTISLESLTLDTVTTYNGQTFYKQLRINDIKTITPISWQARVYNKEEALYMFLPNAYKIESKDGITYYYKRNIPPLNQFVFTNQYGEAKFFTYFMDYKTDNGWKNLKLTTDKLEVLSPLSKVITHIEFPPPNTNQQNPPQAQNTPPKEPTSPTENRD